MEKNKPIKEKPVKEKPPEPPKPENVVAKDEVGGIICCVVAVALIVLFMASVGFYNLGAYHQRKEAVDHGVAEWRMYPTTGTKYFQWCGGCDWENCRDCGQYKADQRRVKGK